MEASPTEDIFYNSLIKQKEINPLHTKKHNFSAKKS